MSFPSLHTTSFRCDGVFIVNALATNDLQTARSLFDDMLHTKADNGAAYFHYRHASTIPALLETFEEIRLLALEGFRPIIHLEAHGNKEDGLLIGDGGEAIDWNRLTELLRDINRLTRNHLGVVLAACQGAHQLATLDITRPCPFYFFVGTIVDVEAGFIEDRMRVFYRTLLSTASIDRALDSLTPHFQKFHAERYFCLAFARYIRDHCVGSSASARVENLVSEFIRRGIGQSRPQRRAVRLSLKARIRSQEAQFYRRATVFLHGRRTLKYGDLHKFAPREDA